MLKSNDSTLTRILGTMLHVVKKKKTTEDLRLSELIHITILSLSLDINSYESCD
jgi:hypothetical protein